MKLFKFILACGLAISSAYLTGCASGQPISGMLYSDVQGPINATGAPRGAMHGQACASINPSLTVWSLLSFVFYS